MTRRVVLLCGPPGSGKTTRAHELAAAHGLEVFDRDDVRWTGDREFRLALAKLGGDPAAQAVVIRSCPTRTARLEVVQLCGATEVELIAVPPAVCRQRVLERGRGDVRASLAGIAQWFHAYDLDEYAQPLALRDLLPAVQPSREW